MIASTSMTTGAILCSVKVARVSSDASHNTPPLIDQRLSHRPLHILRPLSRSLHHTPVLCQTIEDRPQPSDSLAPHPTTLPHQPVNHPTARMPPSSPMRVRGVKASALIPTMPRRQHRPFQSQLQRRGNAGTQIGWPMS